jgi:signal transduction histidine kinase
MGLILLYIGLLVFSASLVNQHFSKGAYAWVSALITLGIMTIVTIFYFSFVFEQKKSIARDTIYESGNIFEYISSRVSEVINSTHRSQKQLEYGGPSFDKIWEIDSSEFIKNLTGFQGILLLEDLTKVLKSNTRKGFRINELLPDLLLTLKSNHDRYLTLRSPKGKHIFVIQYPLSNNRTVVSLFHVDDIILIPHKNVALAKFDLLVLYGDILLCNTFMYKRPEDVQPHQLISYDTEIAGIELQAFLQPLKTYSNKYRDMLPTMLLACGYLLAFFVGFLFYLIQKFKGLGQQLYKANNAKTLFLANVSHEVRTPLHGIIGTVSLMQRTELEPKQSRYLQIITSSAQHLLSLINNLLDLTKIESNSFNFVGQPCDVQQLCKDAIELLSCKALEKKLDLDFKFRQDPSIQGVKIPPQAFTQILINLLGNAIKFTDRGKVSLSVNIKDEGQNASMDVIIEDTGIGIPADRRNVIYEKFSQVDEKESIVRGGTGLGLYLTKSLVEKLGGKITFESTPGLGTTFYIQIPVEKIYE